MLEHLKPGDCSGVVIDAAMKVHSALEPGLLEGAYEACLAYEIRRRGLSVVTQAPLAIVYDGLRVDGAYRVDLLVDNEVIVEIKALSKILPVHHAQLLSYLRLSGHKVGLLINFHVPRLRDGLKRMVNNA